CGKGAISSGVERHVDIVEVGGSKPPSPTTAGEVVTCGVTTPMSFKVEGNPKGRRNTGRGSKPPSPTTAGEVVPCGVTTPMSFKVEGNPKGRRNTGRGSKPPSPTTAPTSCKIRHFRPCVRADGALKFASPQRSA